MSESTDIKTKPARGATPEEDEALGYAETGVITEVTPYKDGTGWSVSWGGWGCGCRNVGVEPRVGDTFTTYGRFGSTFYGQALNGKILWYDSIEQQAANNAAASAEYEAERRREFATNLVKMNADFEALPPAFKVRILRNRANDPDYRWQAMGESYEVFTCQQAVILADWARDATSTLEEACDKIDQWNSINSKDHKPKYDYNAQMKAAPKGWSDEHSGNTHGFAVMLAKAWIMGKDL